MRTVNTSELTGEPLNWAVGKADNRVLRVEKAQYGIGARVFEECHGGSVRYRPIVEWLQCGGLLDKYDLTVGSSTDRLDFGERSKATGRNSEGWPVYGYGANARTAICRAVVAAVSGPVVDVPGELF